MPFGPSKVRRTATLASYALAAALSAQVDAADLQFTVGAKLWVNEWTSWTPAHTATDVYVIQTIASNTHVAVIPQLNAFYGRWLVAGSYFVGTDYALGGGVTPTTGQINPFVATRKEADVNVGYYVLPSLALTLGYKQIQQNFVHIANPEFYKWTGPTIGLLASSPLQGGPLSVYGTFAYGRLGLHASEPDLLDPEVQQFAHYNFNADYFLTELGLAYGTPTPLKGLSLSVTLGYRVQVVSTRDFNLETGPGGGFQPTDLHDVTQGPAFSVLARF
jgi:hypothetical protein